jgi:hypothetical protein
MTLLTTNRFLTKALRTFCCASALIACSAWATVVTWQLSPGGVSSKATSQAGYAITPWKVYNTPVTDTSRAFSFKSASESGAASERSAAVAGTVNHKSYASETSAAVAGTLANKLQASDTGAGLAGISNHKPQPTEANAANAAVGGTLNLKKPQAGDASARLPGTLKSKLQASDTDIQLGPQSTLSQGDGQISARSTQPDESSLFASSNTPSRPTTELDDAMAKSFDEEFVSVPTVQFASMSTGSKEVSATSSAGTIVPLPEMSAFFPIVGLIAAVSCTQILRRRRVAQQIASRRVV